MCVRRFPRILRSVESPVFLSRNVFGGVKAEVPNFLPPYAWSMTKEIPGFLFAAYAGCLATKINSHWKEADPPINAAIMSGWQEDPPRGYYVISKRVINATHEVLIDYGNVYRDQSALGIGNVSA